MCNHIDCGLKSRKNLKSDVFFQIRNSSDWSRQKTNYLNVRFAALIVDFGNRSFILGLLFCFWNQQIDVLMPWNEMERDRDPNIYHMMQLHPEWTISLT